MSEDWSGSGLIFKKKFGENSDWGEVSSNFITNFTQFKTNHDKNLSTEQNYKFRIIPVY